MAEVLCVGKAFAGAAPFLYTLTGVREAPGEVPSSGFGRGRGRDGDHVPHFEWLICYHPNSAAVAPPPFSSSAQHCRRCQISLAKLVIKTPPHTHTFTKAGIGGRVFKVGEGGGRWAAGGSAWRGYEEANVPSPYR